MKTGYMQKTEYDRCLIYAADRYQGYIDTVEKWGYTAADDEIYSKKLCDMGYISLIFNGRVREGAYKRIYEYLTDGTSNEEPLLIYSDEDVLIDGKRLQPFFKPPFSPDTLDNKFYLGNFLLLSKELAGQTGLLEQEEFCMKYKITEREKIRDVILKDFYENYSKNRKYNRVLHIPEVLFHNYELPDYSYKTEGRRFDRKVLSQTTVSAVILSKDNPELLKKCIAGFKNNMPFDIEYIVVDNGSSAENRQIIEELSAKTGFSYYYHPVEFIYSALCNYGAGMAKGEYLLFLNDDVELPDGQGEFIYAMLNEARKEHAGAVGVRLLYPSGALQHVGMTNLFTGPSHYLATFEDSEPLDEGYHKDYPYATYGYGRNRGIHNVMGVTGACLLVSKEKFCAVNGFDESIKVAYTDTDLCMDLYDKGYYNIVVNDYYLYHHESLSRGSDVFTPEKLKRLIAERDRLYEKHPYIRPECIRTGKYAAAVFSNPNLNNRSLGFEPAFYNDWEMAEAEVNELCVPYRVCRLNKKRPIIMGCIDRVERKTDGLMVDAFYYEIEGWVLLAGKDQIGVEPVAAISSNDGYKVFTAHRKPRMELSDIFKKERNTKLSGFTAKISEKAVGKLNADTDLKQYFTFGIRKKNIFGRETAYIGENR